MFFEDLNIEAIILDLQAKFNCHTFILYGSRAKGNFNESSDYDIVGIKETGEEVIREARLWKGYYLDVFIYPESKIVAVDGSFLKLLGGVVLKEKNQIGTFLLKRVEELYQEGPERLSPDEIQVKRLWARKMLDRTKTEDLDGNFRRHWLLTALIEDYFLIRGLWYLGPKESFTWLKTNQPKLCELYEKALRPNASFENLSELVEDLDKDLFFS